GYEFGPSSPSQYAIGFNTIAATYPSAVDNDQVASTGGNTIYYNGVFTIADKTSLALTSAGGIMIWSLDLDAPSPNSLLTTIRQVAGTAVTSTLTGLPEMKIAVYPNPSNGVFTLQNSDVSKLTIVLLNTVGEKKSISVNNNTIDISNEPKGVYYLQITKDNQTVIQKLIVQ
ncbi:MAG TPA: T9SS type A sorting domain-containing protein, partial [Cytophagaceae bacterium]|nr:T9SS type A sorting domain-containing protein [Cytophagaceae bacterium]